MNRPREIVSPSCLAVLLVLAGFIVAPRMSLHAEDLSEGLLVQTPKWNLQPAPFSIAAAASGYTAEALDNAFRAAADPDESAFFDVMDSNSELASLARVANLEEIKLRWSGEKPDYLLINPAFSVEGGASKRLTVSAQLHSLNPFFKLRSISVSVPKNDGLEALMKELWKQIDVPVPALQEAAGGGMELQRESVVAETVAEIAGAIVLDGDGNVKPLALNRLTNKVPKAAATQNRLCAPYQEFHPDLTTARWGRGGLSVDVLAIERSPEPPAGAAPPDLPKNYTVRKNVRIPSGPSGLFGEGYISSYAAVEDVAFIASGEDRMNYLTACYFYKGGLSSNDRNVVFVNFDKSDGPDGKVTASTIETRSILSAYGSGLVNERGLLGDAVRLEERPSMRLDPTGNYWTYFSPAAGGLLVFKNAATVEGSFAAGQPKAAFAGAQGALEPACHYRPEANYRLYEHAFTPNGRALVLILEKTPPTSAPASRSKSRKVVLWDFRGDRGVVTGDRNTNTAGLYNGGSSPTPACLEMVAESSNGRLFQTIRFGVTDPRHPGGLLILGCTDASYDVWKFAVTAEPPADRDHGSILIKRYFAGTFPEAYKNKSLCPLLIAPGYNRVLMGGKKTVEHQLLYQDRKEATQ